MSIIVHTGPLFQTPPTACLSLLTVAGISFVIDDIQWPANLECEQKTLYLWQFYFKQVRARSQNEGLQIHKLIISLSYSVTANKEMQIHA